MSSGWEDGRMCRNIRALYNLNPPARNEEIRDASLQFVRKISGFRRPSRANEVAFASAVNGIAAESRRLLASLVTPAKPRDRGREVARAQTSSSHRYRTRTAARG